MQFTRTEMLFGPRVMERFAGCRVAVFGIGGVGGHAAEALVRSGIGAIDLIDSDRVCPSNLNRQIFATRSVMGRYKVDAARDRLLDINPDLRITVHRLFYTAQTVDQLDLGVYDYIIDAVDTVSAKLLLAEGALAAGVPIISSMGTGNKLDPTALQVADVYETSVCPLARIMRRECRKRGIPRLKCVYSQEPPLTPLTEPDEPPDPDHRRQTPGSTAFVPSVAGLILAGEVLRDLAAGTL